jgi:hypothetical protein
MGEAPGPELHPDIDAIGRKTDRTTAIATMAIRRGTFTLLRMTVLIKSGVSRNLCPRSRARAGIANVFKYDIACRRVGIYGYDINNFGRETVEL